MRFSSEQICEKLAKLIWMFVINKGVFALVVFVFLEPSIADAGGFSTVEFQPATERQKSDILQICGKHINISHSDQAAKLGYFTMYRSEVMCIDRVRGSYCETFVYNNDERLCRTSLYTKGNGVSVQLFNVENGRPLRFDAPVEQPIITFEAADGAVALIEYRNYVQILNIENNPKIGAR